VSFALFCVFTTAASEGFADDIHSLKDALPQASDCGFWEQALATTL
jgi:hypothetical protein